MNDRYVNPLCTRYSSEQMQWIFSPDKKFTTWRRLWVALAQSEKELGLPITDEQVQELEAHITDIDYAAAAQYEHELRHDVMAHIRAYGDVCPKAKRIIHLGATSCYVGDNTDILIMREALALLRTRLLGCIGALVAFAEKYAETETLAYTHFQPAQPTTVGKRACLWLQDLLCDLNQLDFQLSNLRLLGCKGTTGTAASFLKLFDGDVEKVKRLDALIGERMGCGCVSVSGQTYPRKTDYLVLSVLSGIAQSAAKFSNDIRLLSHLREFDEPFEKSQVGSSAMAYKRNPMRSERIASLARFITVDALNPALTAGAQWFERTLDDSANKRISIPDAFLATDAVLILYTNIVENGTLYPIVMRKNLDRELPLLATENILMYCTKKGGDRQKLHEEIRRLSVETAQAMKETGCENDLLSKLAADPMFNLSQSELESLCDASSFTGMAAQQTHEYLDEVKKILFDNAGFTCDSQTVRV